MAALPNIETPSNGLASTLFDTPVAGSAGSGAAPIRGGIGTTAGRASVLAMLDAHAQQHPLNRALVMAGSTSAGSINYVELAGKVRRLSKQLSMRFSGRGARIAILSESCPAWGIVALATIASEHVLVPLDTSMELDTLEEAVRRVQPAMVVCSPSRARVAGDRIAHAAPDAEVICIDPCVAEVAVPPAGAPQARAEPGARGSHAAIIAFTSGTTSTPKAVEIGVDNLLFQIRTLTACFGLRPSDRLLSLLPMHHMLELTAGFLCPLWAGAEIHYLSSLMPDDALRRIRAHGLTRAITVPAWLGLLKKTLELDARALASLDPSALRAHARRALGPDFEHFVCGGAALADGISEFFETAGIAVTQGYGLTETSPVVATNTRTGCRRGSVGRPLDGTEASIAPSGEILVRGPHVAGNYRLDDGGVEALTDGAGWFHTGDLGRIDADGFLYVTGRIKSTIVLANGKNVQPEEIEARLEVCEGVAEIGVVAVSDPARGDEICVVAVPARHIDAADNGAGEDRESLESRIRGALASLAPHKRPRHVVMRDQPLPRTAAGKLRRAELAAWAGEAIGA